MKAIATCTNNKPKLQICAMLLMQCALFGITRHVCHVAALARTLRELPSAEAIALRAEVILFPVTFLHQAM